MRSEGDAKGKTPILLASVEMKSQQIFTNSLKYFNDNENDNCHPDGKPSFSLSFSLSFS